METQTHKDSLEIANQLVGPLLNQTPYGADCGVEVSQKLQEGAFMRSRQDQRLRYFGKKVTVIYDSEADNPFSIVLDENDSDAISEARSVSSKLIEILEDI